MRNFIMSITILPANQSAHATRLRHLYQLYLYEFSRFTAGYRVDADGLFDDSDLDDCWTDRHRRIFMIDVDDAPAGFAMLDLNLPDATTVNELSEFFILPAYQKRGVGEYVACSLFDRFPNRWELAIVETNTGALHFWRRVLARYTSNRYTEHHRPADHDYLHAFSNLPPSR